MLHTRPCRHAHTLEPVCSLPRIVWDTTVNTWIAQEYRLLHRNTDEKFVPDNATAFSSRVCRFPSSFWYTRGDFQHARLINADLRKAV
jgi:hypothetical protein